MASERSTYEAAAAFVRLHYFDLLAPIAGFAPYAPVIRQCADTARALASGTWSIPDIVAVRYIDLPLLGVGLTEVHAFEVKQGRSLALPAAYEAAAQTRGAHFGSVIAHTGSARDEPAHLREVADACEHFGVGLCLIWGGIGSASLQGDVLRKPRRLEPAHEAVEAALETLLTVDDHKQLAAWRRRGER